MQDKIWYYYEKWGGHHTSFPPRRSVKAGKYEFNPNRNKSNLLVTSLMAKAFKISYCMETSLDFDTNFIITISFKLP